MSYFYHPSSIRLDRHILEAFKWKDVELKKNIVSMFGDKIQVLTKLIKRENV